MAENFRFNLPPGRVISGSPTFKQDKDMQGKVKDKPNWFMAVAVPKTAPGVDDVINLCVNVARGGYANHPVISQRIALGLKGGFAWKIDDGDDPIDPKNKGKEGWANCWIFKFSTTLGVMNCCNAQNEQIDPALIKTGYFVDVQGSTSVNENTDHTAGIYLNPSWVRLLGFGQEIQSGPTAQQAFANAPASLPQGASATPLAPAGSPPGAGFGGAQPQSGFGGFGGGAPAPAANGFGGAQPQPQGGFNPNQPQPQPQSGFNPNQPQSGFNPNAAPTAEQVAAQHGKQHHPGWRWNPATGIYDQDVPPAAGQGVPAGGTGHPAHSGGPGFSQATASPGSAYPGATPHHGFGR